MDKILNAIGPFLGSTILWFVLAGIALWMYIRYKKEANAAKPKVLSNDYRDELLRVNDRILQDLESLTANGNTIFLNPKFADNDWRGLMQSFMDYFKQDGEEIRARDIDTIPDEYLAVHKTYIEGIEHAQEGINILHLAMNNKKADIFAAVKDAFTYFEDGSAKTDAAITELLRIDEESQTKKKKKRKKKEKKNK